MAERRLEDHQCASTFPHRFVEEINLAEVQHLEVIHKTYWNGYCLWSAHIYFRLSAKGHLVPFARHFGGTFTLPSNISNRIPSKMHLPMRSVNCPRCHIGILSFFMGPARKSHAFVWSWNMPKVDHCTMCCIVIRSRTIRPPMQWAGRNSVPMYVVCRDSGDRDSVDW